MLEQDYANYLMWAKNYDYPFLIIMILFEWVGADLDKWWILIASTNILKLSFISYQDSVVIILVNNIVFSLRGSKVSLYRYLINSYWHLAFHKILWP